MSSERPGIVPPGVVHDDVDAVRGRRRPRRGRSRRAGRAPFHVGREHEGAARARHLLGDHVELLGRARGDGEIRGRRPRTCGRRRHRCPARRPSRSRRRNPIEYHRVSLFRRRRAYRDGVAGPGAHPLPSRRSRPRRGARLGEYRGAARRSSTRRSRSRRCSILALACRAPSGSRSARARAGSSWGFVCSARAATCC